MLLLRLTETFCIHNLFLISFLGLLLLAAVRQLGVEAKDPFFFLMIIVFAGESSMPSSGVSQRGLNDCLGDLRLWTHVEGSRSYCFAIARSVKGDIGLLVVFDLGD